MITFAPAVRTDTAIILALAGSSGSGKTKSALELATGLAGSEGRILVVDSEGGRAMHYADDYQFYHYDWRPPYSPQALGEILKEAESQKFGVVIVDSMSSEHEDEGGLCDMAEAEMEEQRKKGWDLNSAAAWAKPKAAHKQKIIRWLRQSRCHVIFCLRADEKVRFEQVVKDGKKRTVVVPVGWTPIAEKRLLYDVTTSLLFTPDNPGVPSPIKLYDKHARFFPSDKQVSRAAGRALASWSAGGKPAPMVEPPSDAKPHDIGFGTPAVPDSPKRTSFIITGGRGGDILFPTIAEWRAWWLDQAPKLKPEAAAKLYDRNVALFDDYRDTSQGAVNEVVAALRKRFALVSA